MKIIKKRSLHRDIFTTGEVAAMLGVAPRTVAKMADTGRLKHFRIPGSRDRRFLLRHVKELVEEYGLHVPLLYGSNTALIVAYDPAPFASSILSLGFDVKSVSDGFAAGVFMANSHPNVVLIHSEVGTVDSVAIARGVREIKEKQDPPIVLVHSGEVDESRLADHFDFFTVQANRYQFDAASVLLSCGVKRRISL